MDGETGEAGKSIVEGAAGGADVKGAAAGNEAGKNAGADVQALGQDGKPLSAEQKAAAEKTAADAKAAELAKGAEIELKLPEGFKPDEAAVTEFKKLGKELGLDSAKAQKVFDLYAKTQSAQLAALDAAASRQEKTWEAELRADKDFGGNDFKANVVLVDKALVKFDPDKSARKAIGESGLGSHPAVVKFLNRVGKAIAEDHVGKGAGEGEVSLTKEQELQQRFPKSYDLMNPKRA